MVLRVRGNAQPTGELKDDPKTTQTGEEHGEDVNKAAQADTDSDTSPQASETPETATQVVEEPDRQEDDAQDEEPEPQAQREPVTIDNEPEQQEAAAEPEAKPQQSQAVATRQESTAVSTAARGSENYFKQLIEKMAEDGQEGLEMGFGVFPVISLDKGEFKVGDEDMGDSSFQGVPLMSKPKFCYRTTGVTDKDAEVIFADSDSEHLDERSAVSAKLLEWKEKWENSSWECKQYQDVFIYVTKCPDKPELEEQLCQLSVAPQSVKLYTRACLQATGRGRKPHECVFEVGVGEKIRGEFDYYPWAFKAIGSCQRLGVTVNFGGTVDEDF